VGDPSMLRGAAWPPQFPGAKENPASAGLKLSEADGATKVEKYSRGPPSRPPPEWRPSWSRWVGDGGAIAWPVPRFNSTSVGNGRQIAKPVRYDDGDIHRISPLHGPRHSLRWIPETGHDYLPVNQKYHRLAQEFEQQPN